MVLIRAIYLPASQASWPMVSVELKTGPLEGISSGCKSC